MRTLIARFIRDEQGQDLIEYALLGGIITAVGAALINAIGTQVGLYMTALRDAVLP